MPKQSGMLKRLNAQNKAMYKREYDAMLGMAIQMCGDAAAIAAHDILGMGAGRVEKFLAAYTALVSEISKLINSDDPDLEYTKAKVDGKLKQICGDKFVPWDERYGGS